MPGVLTTLGGIGAGISDALPKIIQENEKRLNAEFVTELQRATSVGGGALEQLLANPRFTHVSAEVRQKAMELQGRTDQTAAAQANADRMFRLNVARQQGNENERAAQHASRGFTPVRGEPDEFGIERITGVSPTDLTRREWEVGVKQKEATLAQTEERTAAVAQTLRKANARKGLVDRAFIAAIKNPQGLANYEPDVRQEVQIRLSELGIDSAKKRGLPYAVVKQKAEFLSAIAQLKFLGNLLDENSDITGPVGGLVSYMTSYPRRTRIQAEINVVRQRVGKALEGGVLRAEDEKKYKTILATIWDFDKTAQSKIAGLIRILENDIGILEGQWSKVAQTAAAKGVNSSDLEQYMEIAIRMGLISEAQAESQGGASY